MNIFDDPCYQIRAHVPTAPGTGALAIGPRTLPSVGTRIFTAAPSWRPPGGSTVSLGAISVNSIKNPQKYRALGDMRGAEYTAARAAVVPPCEEREAPRARVAWMAFGLWECVCFV